MREVDLYIVSSAVCTVEVMKLVISAAMEAYNCGSIVTAILNARMHIIESPMETLLMLVPAAIYAAQNNMVFVAISNLDPMTFQVTYQLKILTTAIFSVTMLNRSLAMIQWISLSLLVVGVVLVQMDGTFKKAVENQNPALGFLMVCLCSLSSGFSGVYFEKVIKSRTLTAGSSKPSISIWIRNIQLGIFGLFFSVFALILQDGEVILEKGYFFGYDWVTWIIMGMQAFGGLLVGVVISYADNLLKGFATSISIVLSSWLAFLIFGAAPSTALLFGGALVILATCLYSLPAGAIGESLIIEKLRLQRSAPLRRSESLKSRDGEFISLR